MKKFILLYVGYEEPTQEIKAAWGKWHESVADMLVDSGNPFGAAKEISHDGTKDLPLGLDAITGYSIINAQDLDEAAKIAAGCPTITSVRVYEAMPM